MLPSYLDMIKIWCFKRDSPVKLRNSVWPSQENGCLHRNMSMYENNIHIRYRHGFDKKSLTGIRMTSVIIRHCCDEAIVTFSCWILPRLFTPWHHPYIWHCIDGFIMILSQREQLRISWLSLSGSACQALQQWVGLLGWNHLYLSAFIKLTGVQDWDTVDYALLDS